MNLLQPAAAVKPMVPAVGTELPRRFLLCHAGGRACGFDSAAVLEVMPATPPAVLPGMAPPVLGLVCVRGAVVPVVDLAAALGVLLGSGSADVQARARPALHRTAVHVLLRDGARLAVAVVDAVGELFELPPGAGVLDTQAPASPCAAPLRGEIWRHGERVLLLDAAALLRAPSTALAAANVCAPASAVLSKSNVRP